MGLNPPLCLKIIHLKCMRRPERTTFHFLFCLLICFGPGAFSQQKQGYIASLGRKNHWVDSVYKKLSKKQRVAQLFFVRAHTDRGEAYEDSVGNVIKDQQVGGL